MAIKVQRPYVDENKIKHDNLERRYSDEGKPLIQVETGFEYDEAIDVSPSRFTYIEKENENTGD